MATEEEIRSAQARVAQGAKSIRPSVAGTNDWLDDITETLTAASKRFNEVMQEHPDTKAAYLPVLQQLVDLSFRMITMRHDVTSGQPPRGPVDSASGSGEDGGMEARISALEKDVAAIKTDVAVIRSNYSSKEDLHKELHATTWKIVGAITLLCGAVFWMARNIQPPSPVAANAVSAPSALPAPAVPTTPTKP